MKPALYLTTFRTVDDSAARHLVFDGTAFTGLEGHRNVTGDLTAAEAENWLLQHVRPVLSYYETEGHHALKEAM